MKNDFYDKKLKDYSCYVECRNGDIATFSDSGIIPLLKLINDNKLQGANVADRVIGKAAALLMVYGGVKRAYTKVISRYAVEVFEKYNIEYNEGIIVPYIVNRNNDGMCPMEKMCLTINNPKQAYFVLIKAVNFD